MNKMIRTINFENIKPIGNFKKILEKLREMADEAITKAHEEKAYHKGISDTIKLICGTLGVIEVLEGAAMTGETWDMEENMQCLLYTHLIIVDLNQTAHTYLNKITKWDSPMAQLQDLINDKPEVYRGLKIVL